MKATAQRDGRFVEIELPTPAPGPDEVRIRVAASSINPADEKVLRGDFVARFLHGRAEPLVVGYDVAGEVDALGSDVSDLSMGDAVFGHLAYTKETARGAFAEYVVLPARRIAVKPEGISDEVAAAAATVGLTALQSLRDEGRLREGGRALIIGAGGGVGSVAVGVAKRLGAEVTGVCSTKDVERVETLGADEVIDRKKTDLFATKNRFDVVFDTPAVHSYGKCSALLERGGTYVTTLPGLGLFLGMALAPLASKRCRFIAVSSKRADLELLGGWLSDEMDVPIDSTHPVRDLETAVARQADRARAGKVVIDVANGW